MRRAPIARPALLGPLSHRTYRRLFAAQVVALFGTGLTTVALALLAYDLAGGDAGLVLSIALALKMVAYVTLAPLAGAIAHLLPRRALLVALDLARALVVLGLPFVTEIWQIYLLIFLVNAASAGFTPLFQATIPDLLPDEADYTRALSLSRLAYDLETLLSPTAAALALLLVSYDGLFLANTAAFLISAGLVGLSPLPRPRPPERGGGPLANLGAGLRIYLGTPRLRGLLALNLAVAAAGAMILVNTVVLVRARLGGDATDTALAFAAAGAGSMAVALALPRLLARWPDRPVMLTGGALLAASLATGLLATTLGWLLALWALLGAGGALIQTPAGRLLRRSAAAGDRPALFATQFTLSHLCWLGTYPLAGWAGAHLGPEATFALLAGLCLAAALAAARLWPARDPQVLAHSHGELHHDHLHVHDAHHQHAHAGWEGPEPHRHPHRHPPLRHTHAFVIDLHHPTWPRA